MSTAISPAAGGAPVRIRAARGQAAAVQICAQARLRARKSTAREACVQRRGLLTLSPLLPLHHRADTMQNDQVRCSAPLSSTLCSSRWEHRVMAVPFGRSTQLTLLRPPRNRAKSSTSTSRASAVRPTASSRPRTTPRFRSTSPRSTSRAR